MVSLIVRILCLISVAFCIPADFKLPELKDGGVHWALLVAGSHSWFNYRHQADVCHAYHILSAHGIPDERIIVMMYDDIANNRENPTKGKIINQPNGPDVYEGVPKDYTKNEVDPEVFLNVLTGNKKKLMEMETRLNRTIGSRKVIKSGPNDNVFVNFVDHGAPGLVAFGTKMLHAKQLNKALKDMHKEKKYNKLVLYIEACEAGSMFKKLEKNLNILAITAANATQSSYACYFDKKRKTYLGDLFSVNWMQDSDKEDLTTETIEKQYHIVREETNRSHVMEYGDLTMTSMKVSEFQGGIKSRKVPVRAPNPSNDAVPSEDVELEIYKRLQIMSQTKEEKMEAESKISEIIQKRERIMAIMKSITANIVNDVRRQDMIMMAENELNSYDCYIPVVEHLKDTCKELDLPTNGYALKQLQVMVNLCEAPNQYPVDVIMEAIDKVCEPIKY